MSQHLKDRWGNRSRTSEDDHRSEKHDYRDRNRDHYRSRDRDRSTEKYPGRPRSRSRDRGRSSRESRSRSRSRSREYTRFRRNRSPSYEGRRSGSDTSGSRVMPPRPPPLGKTPAPPPLGIIPVVPPPGVPPCLGVALPPPPPMSLVARATHSPSPSPPPPSKPASESKPTALPLTGSKQFGIKLSLSNSTAKPVKKSPKTAVSSVFNNDSSDDEEEVPADARYKLFFAHRVKKRVTHG